MRRCAGGTPRHSSRFRDRKSEGLVPGAAWSPYLEGSKDLVADWVDKKCGNFNTKTNKCGS